MEFRRVYRGVEDTLGNPPPDIHPHSWLSRRLRFAVRETRDLSSITVSNALCLASISGNPSVDAHSAIDSVSDKMSDAYHSLFPYEAKRMEPKEPKVADHERYFKMLDEMEAEAKSKKEKAEKEAAAMESSDERESTAV